MFLKQTIENKKQIENKVVESEKRKMKAKKHFFKPKKPPRPLKYRNINILTFPQVDIW